LCDFQRLANKYIKEIRDVGQVPFLVGGSGLYIDSILFDYQLGPEQNNELRQELDKMSTQDLLTMLKKQHIETPSNSHNKRHLIRAIEQNGVNRTRRDSITDNVYVVGISTDKDVIEQRIRDRAVQMLDGGLIEETKQLVEKYGEVEPLCNNLPGEVQKFLRGEINRDELIERMVIVDRQLVKKQMTWFRRNQQIKWLSLAEAEKYITSLLTDSKE
jgi:tRNA dimethylallyltransferase